jgi:hypothetical protein
MYPARTVFLETQRLLGSTLHWRPLVNGYGALYPPEYAETVAMLNTFPSAAAVQRLRELRVRYVVIYLGQYADQERAQLEGALQLLPAGVARAAVLENTVILEIGPAA